MPHPPKPLQTCQDCGKTLHGRYCAHCGQSHTGHELGFHHALEETLESLLHLDGRLLRTFRLHFIRPGELTADYLAGRRTRHMPPLRLYLIASFVLFLVMGFAKPEHRRHRKGKTEPEVILRVNEDGAEATPSAEGPRALPPEEGAPEKDKAPKAAAPKGDAGEEEAPQAGESTHPLERKIKRSMKDPEAFRERMVHLGSRTAFLLLPVFAAMLWALFFRSRRRFLEHVIFSLHFHAFVFGILALDLGLNLLPWKPLHTFGNLLFLTVPIYFGMAIRRVYGQSLWGILWKGALLSAAYLVLLLTVLTATFAWAVAS